MVYLSSIRLCRERFETMLVATIRHLPDVSSKVLCLIGNNKEEFIRETISDAFRDTAPGYVQDHLAIKVDRIDEGKFALTHWTEDDGQMLSAPRCVIVTIENPPVYGKD